LIFLADSADGLYTHAWACTGELALRLPAGWFRKRALCILQGCGKLARQQVTLPNPLHEGSVSLQFLAVVLVRIKNPNWHMKFLRNDPYRFHQVGIVGYEHCDFELLAESISNEMGCEVDIRSLFFGFFDLDSLRRSDYSKLHRAVCVRK
jgi:hypothetical protein